MGMKLYVLFSILAGVFFVICFTGWICTLVIYANKPCNKTINGKFITKQDSSDCANVLAWYYSIFAVLTLTAVTFTVLACVYKFK
jgi:uncharacterized membrane protein